MCQFLLGLGEAIPLFILRPLGDHDRLALVRQALPDFLSDIGHEGVQQLQGTAHNPHQHLTGSLCLGFVVGLHPDLGDLDIPVAEAIPQEIVELLDSDTQLEFLQIVGDLFGHIVQSADNPLVLQLQRIGQSIGYVVTVDIHEDKASGIPNLVGKVPAGGYLLVGEAQVVSGAIAGHQGKAQGICTMTSSGSMPLPRDLLILRPCASRTRPWKNTVLKGGTFMFSMPEKIILATQKKMIS